MSSKKTSSGVKSLLKDAMIKANSNARNFSSKDEISLNRRRRWFRISNLIERIILEIGELEE